jgi:hypothetical protein
MLEYFLLIAKDRKRQQGCKSGMGEAKFKNHEKDVKDRTDGWGHFQEINIGHLQTKRDMA